ncbi:MAG: hypothetical protein HQL37_09155 [Alphaproteobacteria bacterium]|nr:hypothetical protein [Alphaproteobacteria bacterium]
MHIDRMSKLLALASSSNDREALAALRSLRRLLATDEMDFVDLANLLRGDGRAEDLQLELETTQQQLRQARGALRSAQAGSQGNQTVRELRQQVRQLTVENQTLKGELDLLSEELEEWRTAHSTMNTTLRQYSHERLQLKSKLRQKQMEMERVLGEVRGMINLTSKLRTFVDSKMPAA